MATFMLCENLLPNQAAHSKLGVDGDAAEALIDRLVAELSMTDRVVW